MVKPTTKTITKKSKPAKSNLPSYLQEIYDMEDTLADETIESEFSFEVTPEGEYPARLVEFIELGKHAGNFEGKPTKPSPKVRLTFELLDPDLAYETEDASGKKSTAYPTQSVELSKGSTSKSKYLKFLKAFQKAVPDLADKKQMVMFVNQPIVLKITHTAGKKDPNKTYINILPTDIQSVVYKDKRTKEVLQVEVPEATKQFRVLLWNSPTIGQWDSLFIDGERDGKDGEKVSKNWIQNKILEATNFAGSDLSLLLQDAGLVDGDLEDDIVDADDIMEDDEVTDDSDIDEDVLDDGDFLEDDAVEDIEEEVEDEAEAEEVEEEEIIEEEEVAPAPKKLAAKTAASATTRKPALVSKAGVTSAKTTSPSKPLVVQKKRAAGLAKDIGLTKK